VLAAGRAAAGLSGRVHEAVLALIGAADPIECVTAEFPALLAVDAAALCAEQPFAGARLVPAGTVARLLGGRAVVFREGAIGGRLLHGEAEGLAHHDALIRVPTARGPMMLALVSRDRLPLDPAQGAGALAFLGRAIAEALGRSC
jgi:hypothetical protein